MQMRLIVSLITEQTVTAATVKCLNKPLCPVLPLKICFNLFRLATTVYIEEGPEDIID